MEDIINFINKVLSYEISKNIISVCLIFILAYISLKVTKKVFKIATKKLQDAGQVNISYMPFLQYAAIAFIYFIAVISVVDSIDSLKSITKTVLASSGILAVVLGIASQDALANIVSGIMILIFKPFIVGDTIRDVSFNILGTVEDISLRHTVIRTLENKRVLVPNGSINKNVIENSNFIETTVYATFDIGISYDSDIEKAKSIIQSQAMAHKDFLDNRTPEQKKENQPAIIVRVVELADSSINLRTWIWGKDNGTAFVMKCDLLESIKKEFDQQGINIPYPHITISK